MMRFSVGLGLLALLAGPVFAQGTAYFPSNTPSSGSGNTFPFGNAFGPNWRYQGLLPAANLPAGKIKITEVAVAPLTFSAAGGMGFAAPQFQVRMSNFNGVFSSIFANNLTPCPIQVYDGPIRLPVTLSQWNAIGLQTSFGYDGDVSPQPDIVLEIRYQGRSTVSTDVWNGFRCYSDATLQRVWANNLTAPLPADPYSAASGTGPSGAGIKVCLTYSRTCICDVQASARIGTSVPVSLLQMPVGQSFQIAASLGQRPAINVGPCSIGLQVDGVLIYSVSTGVPIFNGYQGIVPASGNVTAKWAIPNLPGLVGVCIYHAALAFGPNLCCTNTEGTMLTP